MGCVSSKRVESAVIVDVYRPPPTSIAVFDINTIEEPWHITTTTTTTDPDATLPDPEKKHGAAYVPLPILEKLDAFELAPQSWSEVSKALEDLKPALHIPPPTKAVVAPPLAAAAATVAAEDKNKKNQGKPPPPQRAAPEKNHSFHTLEELEAKLSSDKKNNPKAPSPSPRPTSLRPPPPSLPEGLRPVSQSSFILKDREEREKKNGFNLEDPSRKWRRDPLDGLPELCPPGGADRLVLYTTTLRGVRRTFEDCEKARQLVEAHCLHVGIDVDERDVSLHGEYLKELRELVGEEASVPRLFVKGRYVGGVEEVVEMNETGRLRLMVRLVRGGAAEDGAKGRRGCGGCGGARFVPCTECSGSCKVVAEDGRSTVRCGRCNENGLVQCPRCH